MTKFLKVGTYQPQDYTKADYMQYLYLKKRAGVALEDRNMSNNAISSVKSNESDALYELFEFHMQQLEQYIKGRDFVTRDMDEVYLPRLRYKMQNEGLHSVIETLQDGALDLWVNEEPTICIVPWVNQEPTSWIESKGDDVPQIMGSFTVIRLAFLDAMKLAIGHETYNHVRDPAEFAPSVRSMQYLSAASNHNNFTVEMHEAHEANMRLVNASDFDARCEQEFLYNGPIVEAKLAQIVQVPTRPSRSSGLLSPAPAATADNAGFFLKVYYHPAFKHWLTQMLLAAIVLTAALVTAAFMLNASMLPLAVAGVVKGLSSMAAKTVFGSAVVVGTAATFTLGASLHARFFSEARDGATPPAGAGVAPSVIRR